MYAVYKMIGTDDLWFCDDQHLIYGRYNDIKNLLIKRDKDDSKWLDIAEILQYNNLKLIYEVINKREDGLEYILEERDHFVPWIKREMA